MFNVKVFKIDFVVCPLTGEDEEFSKCKECRHNKGLRYSYAMGHTETRTVKCLYGG